MHSNAGFASKILNNNDENSIINNSEENNITKNRTLLVGPSFCGKTHLLLNNLQLNRLDKPEQKIRVITRSPEQYKNIETEDASVEEFLVDRTIQVFQNCCVVFDDILDSNRKLIDPFFIRGRHNHLDVYYLSQS